MEKVNVSLRLAYRLIHSMHTVLVTCIGSLEGANIITLAWAMPTSIGPPLLAVSISHRRHSHHLIEETKEFVVNMPTMGLRRDTLICGRISGKT